MLRESNWGASPPSKKTHETTTDAEDFGHSVFANKMHLGKNAVKHDECSQTWCQSSMIIRWSRSKLLKRCTTPWGTCGGEGCTSPVPGFCRDELCKGPNLFVSFLLFWFPPWFSWLVPYHHKKRLTIGSGFNHKQCQLKSRRLSHQSVQSFVWVPFGGLVGFLARLVVLHFESAMSAAHLGVLCAWQNGTVITRVNLVSCTGILSFVELELFKPNDATLKHMTSMNNIISKFQSGIHPLIGEIHPGQVSFWRIVISKKSIWTTIRPKNLPNITTYIIKHLNNNQVQTSVNLPETNSSPLNIRPGPQNEFSSFDHLFQGRAISGRVKYAKTWISTNQLFYSWAV